MEALGNQIFQKMTTRIQNLDYETLDFDYINIHAAGMIPSRILKQCYDKRFDSGMSTWNIFLDNIIKSIENRYSLKWERIASALFSEYDILRNVKISMETNKNRSLNDSLAENESNIANKSENTSDVKKKVTNETGADKTEETSDTRNQTSRSNSSQALEENGYYGFNSNVSAPATNATNSSGEIESSSSEDSDSSSSTTNRVSNSETGETRSSEMERKNIESRNLDNERKVKENEVELQERLMQTLPAPDLIAKEIELRKETMVSIMFNDVDKILCLSTF